MTAFVVDTNVAVVANEAHPQASDACVMACMRALQNAQSDGVIVIDAGRLILEEYRANLSLSGQLGVGDAFFRWLWDKQGMPEHCKRVPITPIDGGFQEFPDDPELTRFDPSDRKFVAVALASKSNPEVLNAVDRDWWDFREALNRCGVRICFLCREQFR